MKLVAVLVVLLVVAQLGQGLYFFLEEGKKKCFIENLPKDTLVIGKFRLDDINAIEGAIWGRERRTVTDENKALGAIVTVNLQDDKGNIIEEQLNNQYGADSRFAFTSRVAGEYLMCIQTNTSRWFGTGYVRANFELLSGTDTKDYEEDKQIGELTDLEVYIKKLNDRVGDIRRNQAVFKVREEQLRDLSEEANARSMWASVIQSIFVVAVGAWQVFHLKRFFKQKKVV